MAAVYQEIAKEKGLAMGDFPDPSLMREKLEKMDFTKFPKLDKKTPEQKTGEKRKGKNGPDERILRIGVIQPPKRSCGTVGLFLVTKSH